MRALPFPSAPSARKAASKGLRIETATSCRHKIRPPVMAQARRQRYKLALRCAQAAQHVTRYAVMTETGKACGSLQSVIDHGLDRSLRWCAMLDQKTSPVTTTQRRMTQAAHQHVLDVHSSKLSHSRARGRCVWGTSPQEVPSVKRLCQSTHAKH